ncbi:DUF1641 domain-containing protein [Alicyclobacillus sp. SO9]|uniref:DUF1641 domain-containing protein n=1 Tax=Alicyclobacillus sp. SO9 TaxID=2665646 RepID=UPI0018E78A7E|nr:DUF1641 domain-containing protein [Alicyclobacillus sp. SO9]QQE80087.1 DUF1641 domain-containing protein [Alicyclobacillus sp. SO9]
MPTTMSKEKPTLDVTELLLQPEVQHAVTELIQQLPKLAPLISLLGTGVEVATEALSDAEMMGGLETMVREKAKPLQTTVKNASEAIREAKSRAEKDNTYIGIFGVLRLLKDPNVQYALRFVQGMSDVVSERNLFSLKNESK